MAKFDESLIPELTKKANIGWWEADFQTQNYLCSEYIINLLGLEPDGVISFEDFRKFIREDFRLRTVNEFTFGKTQNVYDQVYPLDTTRGVKWIRVKLCSKKTDEQGNLKTYGFMECIETPIRTDSEQSAMKRINNLFAQQNSISRSLLSLLRSGDMSSVINKILGDIQQQYPDGRTYIVEYNPEDNTQTCRYRANSETVEASLFHPVDIPVKCTTWWISQLIGNATPIIVSNPAELPEEAAQEKAMLTGAGIKSLMAIPLISRNQAWGYAGIDITKEYHIWQNEDYQWFASLINIISICLEFRKSEEQALKEKHYLANLYKHMPMGYVRMRRICDEQGNTKDLLLLDANDMASTIYETSLEYIGKGLRASDPDIDKYFPYLEEAWGNNTPQESDYYLQKQKKYCHAVFYSPQKDEIISLFTDITATHTAYKALDHSERILRNIYKNLPVGIELYDQDGYLRDINDKELEIFGLQDKSDILGINLFEDPLIPEEGKEKISRKENAEFMVEYDFSKLNGYYRSSYNNRINLFTKVTSLYDAQDHFTNYLLIHIDKTDSIVAHNQIQEFKNFFALVGDYAKVGYANFNALTHDGYALSSWYKNIGEEDGTPLTKIIGVHSKYHPEDQKAMIKFLEEVKHGQTTSFRQDIRILHPNEPITWVRSNILVRNYQPENGVIELLSINYDISELKNTQEKLIQAKEKAEESDRLKSAFLANMSHEIRTPLNAIVGFSGLIAESDDQDDKQQYLEIVEKNNDLLLQLISDILDLSKIEAGTFSITKDFVNVNDLCSDIIKIFQYKTPTNINLFFDKPLEDCQIISDRSQIHQVISNFVNNALKFTQTGSICISYEMRENEIEIYVSDTGIGIAPEKQKLIFERFIKLNNFMHGTGLGLSICKSIIEQLGGQIGVDSIPGQGSRFWFILPLENTLNLKII